jgi:ubiquinone/menaquinone biosynthesis C-methylase UbiE
VISDFLISIARCPACSRGLSAGGACPGCGQLYPALAGGRYLDLRPPAGTFIDLTEYAEEEFHHREGKLRPLFLSARVKRDMMRKMLKPGRDERVLDIGCGNGRFAFFERPGCREVVGIDAGAHFAPEALERVDLVRGDVRLLPFSDASFDKAYSLDVLEHLTQDGVIRMLAEARRVLRPGGKLFLYSHVMMSSKLASFQRGVNRLVRFLDRRGLVDNAPERERKSDHRNPLGSYEALDAVLARTGFEVVRIRYYNVFFKAILEDLMLPLIEHNLYRKKEPPAAQGEPGHSHGSSKPDVGRWAHLPLGAASALMKLDVLLFGRVRTGPFFLLLRAR